MDNTRNNKVGVNYSFDASLLNRSLYEFLGDRITPQRKISNLSSKVSNNNSPIREARSRTDLKYQSLKINFSIPKEKTVINKDIQEEESNSLESCSEYPTSETNL